LGWNWAGGGKGVADCARAEEVTSPTASPTARAMRGGIPGAEGGGIRPTELSGARPGVARSIGAVDNRCKAQSLIRAMTLAEQVASVRRTIHRLLKRRLSRHTERPFTQMLALKAIDRGEVRSQAALAERLLVDPPAVSRLVDRLVEDGLLSRCEGQDRRCVRLEVTDSGRKEVAACHAELERLESEMRKHLTAQEMKTLHQLLEKVHAGVLQAEAEESEK
jgi:MarR family transcriptional regulator for hemolysin